MYCKDCQEQQTIALREVKELLTRLQAAEAVFPSSKALRKKYKKYESPEFVARVKAMCLWYNLTRLHRLKLLIVGKMFARFVQYLNEHYIHMDLKTVCFLFCDCIEDCKKTRFNGHYLMNMRIVRMMVIRWNSHMTKIQS